MNIWLWNSMGSYWEYTSILSHRRTWLNLLQKDLVVLLQWDPWLMSSVVMRRKACKAPTHAQNKLPLPCCVLSLYLKRTLIYVYYKYSDLCSFTLLLQQCCRSQCLNSRLLSIYMKPNGIHDEQMYIAILQWATDCHQAQKGGNNSVLQCSGIWVSWF